MHKTILSFTLRVFLFVGFFLLFAEAYFHVFENIGSEDKLIGREIYHSIAKSKKKSKSKILVLGDSVAKQMYDNYKYNDVINSLACNQAISMVGQYLLLKDFLENNENDELEVYLIYRPSSFNNNLDQPYTFNYFLKPFLNNYYSKYFSNTVWEQIKKIPFYRLSYFSFVKKSNWSPSYNIQINIRKFEMSSISSEYLKKMVALCKNHNAKLKVISSIMSDRYIDEKFLNLKNQIKIYGLEELFKEYFSKMIFLDSSLFRKDFHLKNPRLLPKNLLNLD